MSLEQAALEALGSELASPKVTQDPLQVLMSQKLLQGFTSGLKGTSAPFILLLGFCTVIGRIIIFKSLN